MIDVYHDENVPHVIYLDYLAPLVNWDEYQAAIRKAYNLAASIPGTVYLMHNHLDNALPEGNAFPHLHSTLMDAPGNIAGNLLVITNVFARRTMELALKIAGMDDDFFLLGDPAEAQHLLVSARNSA